MEFNSLEELKKRITPALTIKAEESKGLITVDEIWNYLKNEKWIKTIDLSLAEMVDDILNCNLSSVKEYKNK